MHRGRLKPKFRQPSTWLVSPKRCARSRDRAAKHAAGRQGGASVGAVKGSTTQSTALTSRQKECDPDRFWGGVPRRKLEVRGIRACEAERRGITREKHHPSICQLEGERAPLPTSSPVYRDACTIVHAFHCGCSIPRSAKLGFVPRSALGGAAATRAGAVRGAFWPAPGSLAGTMGVHGEFAP